MEDGSLALERLEEEILGDDDDHATAATTMPVSSYTLFPDAIPFPRGSTSRPPGSTSRPPSTSVRGDHVVLNLGCGSTLVTTRDDNPIVQTHRVQEKKMKISHGKRKHP